MGNATKKSTTGRTTPKGTRPAAPTKTGQQYANTKDRLATKKGIVRRVPIYLDSEAQDRFEKALNEYRRLDLRSVREAMTVEAVQRIQQELLDATEALKEQTVTLTLRRPVVTDEDGKVLKGRRAYEWLLEQYPPGDDDVEEYRKSFPDDPDGQPLYNADTFTPALISACLEEPVMTPEEVDDMIGEWSMVEVMTVFNTCMECSHGSQVATLGKGSGVMSAFTRS
jgi:hypothetical protein